MTAWAAWQKLSPLIISIKSYDDTAKYIITGVLLYDDNDQMASIR